MGGLMDFLSPALTTASQVAGADAEGKKEGNALLRAIHQQQIAEDEKRAMSQKAIADAALANSRIPGLTDPTKVITAPGQPVSVVHTRTGTATPVTTPGQAPDADGNGEQQGTPLITPPRPTKIDPLSPQGIAARKQLQPPAKPRNIDPLSPEGIAARLQLKPPAVGGAKALAGPMAAKVGQAGEMLKKASDLLPMMERLDVTAGQSSAQDIAAHGVGIAGHAIPGSKGIGAALVNRTPDYSAYQAALTPFVLAAAHALSGARINDEQVKQIRASIEVQPGDWNNANVRAQKKKNMIDLMNSINGSLPADAIASQEDQMDHAAMTTMRGHGYRPAARGTVQPQQGTAPPGNVNLGAPVKPAGAVPLGGGATDAQKLWDAAVAKHGQAKVVQEYGPRPEDDE